MNGADAFTPLTLAAAWEPRLRLGTAIAPVYTRGPGLMAMTAAALAETAPGRFQFGIGASSPVVVGDWNAAEFTQPYRRSRDMLRFLRAGGEFRHLPVERCAHSHIQQEQHGVQSQIETDQPVGFQAQKLDIERGEHNGGEGGPPLPDEVGDDIAFQL